MGFVTLERLRERLRGPRSRRDELARLKARYRAQPSRGSAEQQARAERLRELRQAMDEALSQIDIEGCSTCAKGHPLPAGRWHGGHCCGGDTLTIFAPAEVASLRLGGTRLRDWTPPRDDHAGCAFRGSRGCSLEAEHRPSICLQYICLDLRAELKARGAWQRIADLAAALREERRAFEAELAHD